MESDILRKCFRAQKNLFFSNFLITKCIIFFLFLKSKIQFSNLELIYMRFSPIESDEIRQEKLQKYKKINFLNFLSQNLS